MNRQEFRNFFSCSELAVFPVIHVLDNEQAERNVRLSIEAGCSGVFLINHDFEYQRFLPIIKHIRQTFPDLWIGVNFLAVTGKVAFPELAKLASDNILVDGYWADDARIDERKSADDQPEAEEILKVKVDCGWSGMYFGGTAFKKQRDVDPDNYGKSAMIACDFMDVVTTSGVATGHSADLGKIETFRNACGDKPVAVASGITPENVSQYIPSLDCVLVATGINIKDDFYNIDPMRLAKLMQQINKGEHS